MADPKTPEPAKLNHQYTCVVDRDTISLAAKSPPSNTEGGAPSPHYTPMKCSSGILSSHGAVKRKQKPAPGPPVHEDISVGPNRHSLERFRVLGSCGTLVPNKSR